MLADDAEHNAGLSRGLDHLPRRIEVGRNRLLHLDVLFRLGADLDRLQAEVRERADVDVVDFAGGGRPPRTSERIRAPFASANFRPLASLISVQTVISYPIFL